MEAKRDIYLLLRITTPESKSTLFSVLPLLLAGEPEVQEVRPGEKIWIMTKTKTKTKSKK